MSWVRFSAGVLLAAVVTPFAIVAVLLLRLFGVDPRANRTPDDVAGYLRKFIDGTESSGDWYDFEVEIQNPRLEAIRAEAIKFSPPTVLDQAAREK